MTPIKMYTEKKIKPKKEEEEEDGDNPNYNSDNSKFEIFRN